MRSTLLGFVALTCFAPVIAAQCEEAILIGKNQSTYVAWESAAISGNQAVVSSGTIATNWSQTVLTTASVYCYWDAGTPTKLEDDHWILQQVMADPKGELEYGYFEEDRFGGATAIDDDLMLIGSTGYAGSGEVYMYAKDDQGTPDNPLDDAWVERGSLPPIGPNSNGPFANSMDMSGDLLAIGNSGGALVDGEEMGSVCIYFRNRQGTATPLDDTWEPLQQVIPPNNDLNEFGHAVSISEYGLIVGTNFWDEAAQIYRRNDGGTPERIDDDRWTFETTLLTSVVEPDASFRTQFGTAVAISDNRAVVGASREDEYGEDSGAAYVYRRNADGTWLEEARLIPRDGFRSDHFGSSVAIDGNLILIGARSDDGRNSMAGWLTPNHRGSVYVWQFDETQGRWIEQSKLVTEKVLWASMGLGVAMDQKRVIVWGTGDWPEARFAVYLRGKSLCASPQSISVSSGGEYELNFNGGFEHSNAPYFIFGSASGTKPGLPLPGGMTLPLVPDNYFLATQNSTVEEARRFSGEIGHEGVARASISFRPQLTPVLAGVTLHHALIVGNQLEDAIFVSNPVRLELRP